MSSNNLVFIKRSINKANLVKLLAPLQNVTIWRLWKQNFVLRPSHTCNIFMQQLSCNMFSRNKINFMQLISYNKTCFMPNISCCVLQVSSNKNRLSQHISCNKNYFMKHTVFCFMKQRTNVLNVLYTVHNKYTAWAGGV